MMEPPKLIAWLQKMP